MSPIDGEAPRHDRIAVLDAIADSGQAWTAIAPTYGVQNPVPPWKTSLDGMCDALDSSDGTLAPLERRTEEDDLSQSVYAHVPYPESQLLALAHTLVAGGVISERELAGRLAAVRTRLESE